MSKSIVTEAKRQTPKDFVCCMKKILTPLTGKEKCRLLEDFRDVGFNSTIATLQSVFVAEKADDDICHYLGVLYEHDFNKMWQLSRMARHFEEDEEITIAKVVTNLVDYLSELNAEVNKRNAKCLKCTHNL